MNLQTFIFNSTQRGLAIIGQKPLLCSCKKCESGWTFECYKCKREVPWCMGHGEILEDWCDNCADEYEKLEGLPTPLCYEE